MSEGVWEIQIKVLKKIMLLKTDILAKNNYKSPTIRTHFLFGVNITRMRFSFSKEKSALNIVIILRLQVNIYCILQVGHSKPFQNIIERCFLLRQFELEVLIAN